jgi:hypothetical protein
MPRDVNRGLTGFGWEPPVAVRGADGGGTDGGFQFSGSNGSIWSIVMPGERFRMCVR